MPMRIDRRRFIEYAGMVSTATLLAGCTGGGDEETPMGDGEETPTGDGEGTPEDEAQQTDEPGSQFVYVTTITPNTVDPMKASDNLDTILAHNVYDPLLYYTDDTPPELIPWLAEDWEVADDKKTYTISLRDDATFHNGDPVTADDVVYSATRMLNMQRGFSWMWAGILQADGVSKVDDTSVQMQLEQVFAPFPFTLPYMFVVNSSIVEDNTKSDGEFGEHGDYGTEWLESNDAGGGPYTLAERQRKQRIKLEKNDDWWGDFAAGNTFEVATTEMVPEEATVVGKMKDGSGDLSDQWLSLESYDELAAQDHLRVSAEATFNPFYIFMHNQKAPLDDINVRKAISYAFDYETALDGVLAGDSEHLVGPLPSAMWGHNPDVTDYRQDLDKAKEHLDQSDYTADELDLTYTYVSGLTIEQNHGLLLQTNLGELGINLSIEKAPWTNITQMVTDPDSSPEMLAIYLGFSYVDPDTFLYPAWHSSAHGSWQSASWYQNDQVDQLLDQGRTVVDQDERAEIYKEAQKLIAEDAPALFVANQAARFALNKRVKGFKDNGVMGYVHTFHRFTDSG